MMAVGFTPIIRIPDDRSTSFHILRAFRARPSEIMFVNFFDRQAPGIPLK
jgi:hypothetical protein